ncbi:MULTISPECIES: hypothetical protein [Streptomyces]|uniref:Uncharacterized protein n=1 Tax=Streptomyces fuscus TaxID=3048495 RepID=A0ABT7J204_9ACTN|nr:MULTISPECIES: hypothetical protein [Streptomyces]MCM1968763.1 hypothetical protein [Streptomyces sp. G1]MDL2078892.1 hypothetical protein [Streptomyces fuscus]SBT93532.1 hypothetical protein GA0115233_106547 [Streptomyces sp. DI166]
MITQVSRTASDTDPASFAAALEVAYELHRPTAGRAPELATGRTTAHRRGRGRSTRTARTAPAADVRR